MSTVKQIPPGWTVVGQIPLGGPCPGCGSRAEFMFREWMLGQTHVVDYGTWCATCGKTVTSPTRMTWLCLTS